MSRREELEAIFEYVDEGERKLISPLLDEVVFLEKQMQELKKLPFVRVHPNNPAIQKATPASREYKHCTQSYMNAIRMLCAVLHKVESTAEDELMKRLSEFD